tara:strand:+ start:1417 stop:1605 length:189 start_codon:yes stop_codon:yes gene_type:complete
MAIPELIDFQNKKWQVVSKIPENKVDDHTKLKSMYDADLVLKNNQGLFFVLNEVIDAEFEDI